MPKPKLSKQALMGPTYYVRRLERDFDQLDNSYAQVIHEYTFFLGNYNAHVNMYNTCYIVMVWMFGEGKELAEITLLVVLSVCSPHIIIEEGFPCSLMTLN